MKHEYQPKKRNRCLKYETEVSTTERLPFFKATWLETNTCCLLHAGFFLGSLLNLEDGGHMFYRNVD
jgi:hypothetical protein